jgi:hypothetical protein
VIAASSRADGRSTLTLAVMSPEEQPPLRKSRLALAYLLFFFFALPGIMAFFYVQNVLPGWLVHPKQLIWPMFILRILSQVAAGSAVLFPLLLLYFRAVSRLLGDRELRHLLQKFSE